MEFLNLSPLEILVVLIVAFVALGPEHVAEVGGSLGRLARQLRRSTAELTREAITRGVESGGSSSASPEATKAVKDPSDREMTE